jgi:hypothetical protein
MFTKFNHQYTPRVSIIILVAFILAISLIFSTTARADSPRFLNCPESPAEVNHCYHYRYDFDVNLEGTYNSSRIRYELAETNLYGEIDIDPVTGLLQYHPLIWDVIGQDRYFSIRACHMSSGRCDTCTVFMDVINTAPEIYLRPRYYKVAVGDTLYVSPVTSDRDFCDNLKHSLDPGSPGSIDPVHGLYTWIPTINDLGVHNICISVTDGMDRAEICFDVEVRQSRQYVVQIEEKYDVLQGHYVDVNVTVGSSFEPMGGFDFLVGYNGSALAFTEAALSDELVDCGWEYFTYRFNWNGDCGENCPSALVRFVGMAETNNGPYHPDFECINNVSDLLTMSFFVTNDRTWQCRFVPIQFYWVDCGDNAIVTPSGDTLALNRYITDFDGTQIEDYGYGFPGYWGAPDDPCLEGDRVTPVRLIDFINGGIETQCMSIDTRGDINVNGLANEIADWVMFLNYFLQGIYAFGDHVEASIASSDVNCDGTSLRLEDFMKMAQIIVGNDAPCWETVVPDTITADFAWDSRTGAFYVGSPYYELSAVYTVFMGEVIPTLDLDMPYLNLAYTHDSGITRIIVYPDLVDDPPEFNMCRLFSYTGSGYPFEIQAADLYNHVVVTDFYSDADDDPATLPTDFSLHQNHPNPFNPSTEIRFSIPRVSDVTLEIFNVLGQRITTLVDKRLPAGEHAVQWDGCDMDGKRVASGIYLYRLTAGEFSTSKQMILSK